MKNIELKVKVDNFLGIRSLLKENKAKFVGVLFQKDIYFNCKKGRLKMREINKKEFEFIYYTRPDKLGSKTSEYVIVNTDKVNGASLRKIYSMVLGETAIVVKKRNLWLYKHTRIHLDDVRGLGNFVELETVVRGISIVTAKQEHDKVIKMLCLGQYRSLAESYIDLMRK